MIVSCSDFFQFSLRFGPLGWPTYINPVAHSFLEIVIRLLALGKSPEVGDRGAARLSKERLISLGHGRDSLYGNTAGGDWENLLDRFGGRDLVHDRSQDLRTWR
jgi:hypothetical protein